LSPWGENPPTLQNALDYIKSHQYNVVLSLDIKNGNDAAAAWKVVAYSYDYKGNPYYDSVFFKMDTAWNYRYPTDFTNAFSSTSWICDQHNPNNFPPCTNNDSAYIKFMPVFQTSGIAQNLYGSESAELAAMQAYADQPYTVGMEVNLKQNPGILSSLYNWGDSGATHKALAEFNPYKEYTAPNAPDPNNYLYYQYFYSNGYCCAFLSEYFYKGAQSDTQDQRPDWNFILANRNGFNFITTENALAMGNYLWNRGQRNTSYFY
jgi:hypothetical protein